MGFLKKYRFVHLYREVANQKVDRDVLNWLKRVTQVFLDFKLV